VGRLLLALAAVVVGTVVVGPTVSYAVVRWIGWRGVVPLLLGWEPRRAEIGRTWPVCRACGAPLSIGQLPVFPWLAVGGRCRACGEPVSRWVLAVEIATGVGFGVAAARFGWSATLLPVLVLVAGLVALSTVDLLCSRLPRRFVYLTGAAVAVSIGLAVLVDGDASSLLGVVIGTGSYLLMLGFQYLLSGGRMGFGDVRLGAVIGLVVGWVGWAPDHTVDGPVGAVLLGLFAAAIPAAIFGVGLRVARGRSQPYPFGPWLSLGGLAAILLVA
jgi:leader peptidase (prepilin peptidase) / N-methyltransferase